MSDIELRPYSQQDAEAWDEFVRGSSRNGGIFHEQRFLSYHPPERFCDESCLLFKQGKLVGVFPAARKSEDADEVISHPGSSAGGLVYHLRTVTQELLAMLEAVVLHYQQKGYRSLELRLPEYFFAYPLTGDLEYLLWHRGFHLASRELSSAIHLEESHRWKQLGRKRNLTTARSALRKGLSVQREDTVDDAYTIIRENLRRRYEKEPTHSLEELRQLKSLYPERVDVWTARWEERCVAAIVIFRVNKQGVHDFYIAQDYEFTEMNVFPALYQTAIEFYQAEGFNWFNFGISSRGDWIKWGILNFKEGIGGRAACREVWRLENLSAYRRYDEEYDADGRAL